MCILYFSNYFLAKHLRDSTTVIALCRDRKGVLFVGLCVQIPCLWHRLVLTTGVGESFNVWSSGMWVCTATGSTASMKAAGGKEMQPDSADLQ